MWPRKYVRHLSKEEKREIEKVIKCNPDAKKVLKAQSILLSSEQKTVQEIGHIVRVTVATVCNYINSFDVEGLSFLDRKEGSGAPKKILDSIDLDSIIQKAPRVTDDAPSQRGRWTLGDLKIYLKTKYKIDVCNSTVLNELRKRRLKCKMPQITVSSPDPDFDRKKKEIDGLIVDFALNRNHIREHAYLFFLDETLFSLNPPLVKTISKTGEQQKIRTIGDNTNIKVFGAVEPFQGYLLHEFSKTKKSVDFVNFIEYLDYILGKRRKLYVILDNYGIHNSDYTESFIEDLEYEDHLQRLWLPSYSPKLNWIESIWKDAKNHIANFPFNNTDEIIIAVENHWLSLSKKDIQRKIGLNTRLNKMLSKF